ncbi:penicillin acylase family protein [Rhizobacter sp. LjRoot28]|uniref:penicillin acylase family protein n=1 Tax=Rhizobacter sp. LjRoot28 TaxID=3342309 RepID=UPI003ECD6BD4
MLRWLRRMALWGLALLVLAALSLSVYAWRVLPRTDGVLRVPGPVADITIERDADGIPTIRGQSRDDVLFGLGFAHAQDRLWQLETHRRIGSGRLAEAFGEPALDTDRFLRALGVRRAAEAQWAHSGPDARAAVLAYTAGINAFLQRGLQARPPEFVLLGLQPAAWTPQDTIAWTTMMAWDLGGNWNAELLRMRLALTLPVERINQLLPPYPGEQPLATADYAALMRGLQVDGRLAQAAVRAAPPSGIDGVGSNNWVVHGSRTVTGKPLLANDPHLKLSAPALWYFARLEAPGFKVAGATMPGLPMVVLGQNQRIAWGFTNTAPDVQDLYLERVHPGDPMQYQTPTGWARFETAQETIRVRGQPDVPVTVRSTRHGPVISDAGGPTDGLTGPATGGYAIAMRWTALDPDVRSIDTGLALNTAESVGSFLEIARRYVAPMQNMVVADVDGRIAMVAAGRVPLRGPDHDLKGLVPAPGWETRYDWTGFLDPALTPRDIDPPRGFVATANQRVHGPEYPHFITSEWTVPYRHARIVELLASRERHDLDSLRAIQADEWSGATARLLPLLRSVRSTHPLAEAARHEIAAFDATMSADKAAPLIFWAWARHLTAAVFADEVGQPLFEVQLGTRTFREALEAVLLRHDAWWCDDKVTGPAETCAQQIDRAFEKALEELQSRHGSDVATWRWGDAHEARSEHRPFSKVAALAWLFETRVPVGGDTYTVNVSKVRMRPDPVTGALYVSEHGASFRGLYDLADPARSRIMLSTGQSGNVFSPRYRSFVEPWAQVRDVPLWPASVSDERLVLSPEAP